MQNNATDPNNDIDFGAGVMQFDDGTGRAAVTATTKQLDANFVAGTNQGGLDTGAKAADTWYYCYAIYNPTTGASDALFTTTHGSPTMPAGFTKKAYRGALLTDAVDNILSGEYTYNPDGSYRFAFTTRILNLDTTTPSNTRVSLQVSAPPNRFSRLNLVYADNDGAAGAILITEEGQTDEVPTFKNSTVCASNLWQSNASGQWLTNASSEIYYRSNDAAASYFTIYSLGFIDNII